MAEKQHSRSDPPGQQPAFISKIAPPAAASRTVRRPRLVDAVSSGGANGRLSVIRAPAGFGKTTLLLDVIARARGHVCWLSLDDWDRTPPTFLQYLRLAVMREVPASTAAASARERDPRASLAQIVAAIESADGEVLLILDDFHWLDGADEVLDVVDHLLQRLPSNCHLVIASRTSPPLASLPRLRLMGRVADLDAEDLAFTAEEIGLYFAMINGEPISETKISDVLAATQGWPAAVVSLGTDATNMREYDQREALAEYLAAEVMSRLPEDISGFLLATSVLDELTPETCDAVLLDGESEAMLRAVLRQNVPLVRVQSAGGVSLRVHAVLREFLREQLRHADVLRFRELNGRAASWFVSSGRFNEAIAHYALAEDWQRAAEVIGAEALESYRRGLWHQVASWLKLLPVAELRARPALRAWEARILVRLGQPLEALRVVNEALSSADTVDGTVAAELEGIRAAALRVKGDIGASLASGRRAVALAIESNAPLQVVSDGRLQLGITLFVEGSFPEAATELRAVLEMCELRGADEEVAFVSGVLGSALGSSGKLAESVIYLEQGRHAWQKIGNTKELSWVLNNLAMTYMLMGQLERGRELFQLSLSKARDSENRRIEAYALDSLADIEREAGNSEEALRFYEESLEICKDLNDMSVSTLALVGMSDAYRRLGDTQRAEALARQVIVSAKERAGTLEEGLGLVALGKVARQTGRLDEAAAAFQESAVRFEGIGAKREMAEALMRLVDALLPKRGNRTLVRETLEKLAQAGRDLGEDTTLSRHAASLPAVTRYAVARRVAPDFFRPLDKSDRRQASAGRTKTAARREGDHPAVEIEAFGPVEFRIDGRLVQGVEWESEKSIELFLLLLTQDRPMRREEISVSLWPDLGGTRAKGTFHTTLYRVRKAIYPEAILESAGRYFLNPNGSFQSDVMSFLAARNSGNAPEDAPEDALRKAVGVYRGPFAPEIESEWAETLRSALQEQFLRAASSLATLLSSRGAHDEAAAVLERMLESDSYSEDACLRLMESLLALGDREGAARVYRRFARLLEEDLGEHPSAGIQRIYAEVRMGSGRV